MKTCSVLIWLLGLVAPNALGADTLKTDIRSVDSSGEARSCLLSIRTDVDSAVVILDSTTRGRTPVTFKNISPGVHTVRLFHPDQSDWYSYPVVDTLLLRAGEERTLFYRLPRWYALLSSPSGAEVYFGDSLAGTTPLLVRTDPRSPGFALRVQKGGYEPATTYHMDPGGAVFHFQLKSLWEPQEQDKGETGVSTAGPGDSPPPRLLVAGAATLLSGAAAAYFKIKADDRHDAYLLTGNPALSAETNRLDTAAAVFLVATQIGFAFVTAYLLSE